MLFVQKSKYFHARNRLKVVEKGSYFKFAMKYYDYMFFTVDQRSKYDYADNDFIGPKFQRK